MKANQRQVQKAQTRRQLLAAASTEFAARGFTASRSSDVAIRAGVSHGTVFVHFPSQEALIIAVVEEFGQKLARRTHELAIGKAGLREMLAAHLDALGEHEALYTRLVMEARLLPEAARRHWVSSQSALSFHFSQAAEREIEAGRIKDVPLHLLFNTWLGLIHYYLANGDLFAPEGGVIERYGPVLAAHFMNLLSTESLQNHHILNSAKGEL